MDIIEFSKIYSVTSQISVFKKTLLFVTFILLLISNIYGCVIIGFLLSIYFFFNAYKMYVINRKGANYYLLENGASGDDISLMFYDRNTNVIISSDINNYVFYKEKGGVYELSHKQLEKNLFLLKNKNTDKLYSFLQNEGYDIKNAKGTLTFWDIIEILFM